MGINRLIRLFLLPLKWRVQVGTKPSNPDRAVRLACRDSFRDTKILKKIIPMIEEVLSAGGIELPPPPEESIPPAIPLPENIGDDGHRG